MNPEPGDKLAIIGIMYNGIQVCYLEASEGRCISYTLIWSVKNFKKWLSMLLWIKRY